MGQDLRYAWRVLRRAPLFTVTAALSLAVGIAGNAAIFSLADAVLLRPPTGIASPRTLVDVGRTENGEGFDTFSYPSYRDYRQRSGDVFDGLAAFREGGIFGLRAGQAATRVPGGQVSANYFSVLGVPMFLGRPFLAEEERGADPATVMVISHDLWRREFGSDRRAIGRTVRLNDRPFTIVGVASPGFTGHSVALEALWVPLTAYPEGGDLSRLTSRNTTWLQGLGRLKPGVTVEQAGVRMSAIARDLLAEYPDSIRGRGLAVATAATLPQSIQPVVRAFLALLFVLVGLILVIACANVAGMLLARGVARGREVAVRLALGAARGRIVRQLITESLLLAALGGIAGMGLAWVAIRALTGLVPALPGIDVAADFRLDWRVVSFSVLIGLAAGFVCGLVPALQTSRTDLASSVRPDMSSAPRRLRARQAFVVTQLAVSLVLLICALMLTRSLQHADRLDPGFRADNIDVIGVDLRLGGYDAASGPMFADALLARIQALPGVSAAASTRVIPLTLEGYSNGRLWRPEERGDDRAMSADWNLVTPDYFETIGTPLVRGRGVAPGDRDGQPAVAVVNETLARRLWPGLDPIGRTVVYGVSRLPLQVIGVARDASYRSLGETPRPYLYVPLAQHFHPELWLLVKNAGASAIPQVRALVGEMNPSLPVIRSSTLAEATAFGLVPHRLAAWIATIVGLIGLLLSMVGVYGMTAFHVGQRRREIGIRVALGALRRQVVGLIISRSIVLAAIGLAAGLGAAVMVTRLLTSLLFDVAPLDAVSFAGSVALLSALSLIASLIPASRAARLNPVDALRAE